MERLQNKGRKWRKQRNEEVKIQLKPLDVALSVCKLDSLDRQLLTEMKCEFIFLSKTDEEISLVCSTDCVPENTIAREDGWRALKIIGVLDFSLVGILSKIAGCLAKNSIPIFVNSTYNTDYILVKKDRFEQAVEVLTDSGYEVITGVV